MRAPGHRLLLATLLLAGLALAWWSACRVEEGPLVVRSEPRGIMGTRCALVAVLPGGDPRRGEEALKAAEVELRRLEGLLSTWIDASEVSALNRAEAGVEVPLSRDLRAVLRRARELWSVTSGAFDITVGPMIDGWRQAAEEGRLPSLEELRELRGASGWQELQITERGAVKTRSSMRVDIDGIAKGYAIDRAVEEMRRAGVQAGMVEVGGDMRLFGRPPSGAGWPVGVYDPFAERPAGEIEITDRAVCTSGGYARFLEVGGRRYSHILDPRTGRPAEAVASATVLADDAATADAWATALAVLGPAGLEDLPEGLDALLLLADGGGSRGVATRGFPAFSAEPGLPVRRLD